MGIALVDKITEEELRKIVAESFSLSEVISKIGYATCNGRNCDTVKKRLQRFNISTEHFSHSKKTLRNIENVFCKDSTATQSTLRRWFIKQKNIEYKCSICGQEPIWNGKVLTLTLDHIDGHNRNNQLENLRWVCPNCDRQLDTFGSKNCKRF